MRFDKVIDIHYHEIALKGKNRSWFENQLKINVKRALTGLSHGEVYRISGRLLLELREDSPREQIYQRLRRVFGIVYFAEVVSVAQDIEHIKNSAWELLKGREFRSFKVETKRAEKSFPLTSPEIDAEVGAFLKGNSGAAVNLRTPELTCYIEIVEKYAFIYTDRIPGPGGLPVGVSGKAVSLISSGIDSPVASYKIIKRGVELIFVHFHSYPHTSKDSQTNSEELVKILAEYQFSSKFYLVPFLDIQKQIMLSSPTAYRVILYRWAMVRIAEKIAVREGAEAIVTGESIGQVASQTLTNMRAISEALSLPILRPLVGEDKEDIVDLAKKIGTYETSIEPYEDCCSLFVPRHPKTKADIETVRKIEVNLDLNLMFQKALEEADIKIINPSYII